MLKVEQLEGGYGEVRVLRGLSLQVDKGEIVTVLGPNGSGKSTLMKAIVGFVKIDAGAILLDGDELRRVPTAERVTKHGIGYVPQRDNVFASLSVAENIALGGAMLPRRDRRRRVDLMLDLYPQLKERFRSRASSLSGGERQMLAMARALMPSPRLLLLDEPSAGLSPLMTSRLFDAVAETRNRTGAAFLIVEQNAHDSLRVSDRGYVLSFGQVAKEDRAQDLLSAPDVAALYLGTASEETVQSLASQPKPEQGERIETA